MSTNLVIGCIAGYFLILLLVSLLTGKKANNATFFAGNKESPWYVVSFGMIGASLSGVTFISVTGKVQVEHMAYFQIAIGYLIGYVLIAKILLPLYYKLNLISIYGYLGERYGKSSHKTGAFFFLLSRSIGASFRLFLVAMVLQEILFQQLNVPFYLTVLITIALIWVYTFRGGIKTVVWTDTLQTFFMLFSAALTVWIIGDRLDLGFIGIIEELSESDYTNIFITDDWRNSHYFIKDILAGAVITLSMTGLDQDMMQKNLTCKNLKEAKKNMYSFSAVLVVVNFFFLILGALLIIYANKMNIVVPDKPDKLFPVLATSPGDEYLGVVVGISFILGLIAAAYSSADSALTSLTTSICVDFLGIDKPQNKKTDKFRILTHLAVSAGIFAIIMIFYNLKDVKVDDQKGIIDYLFIAANYTYGPLLGLFSFGLFSKRVVRDKFVWLICLLSPIICFCLNIYSEELLFGYEFGFELILVNGLLTALGLRIISSPERGLKS